MKNFVSNLLIFFVLLFAFLPLLNLNAGNINLIFKRISEENGLPGNAIRCVFQDHKGLIWFGIEGFGLCKYDGYTFKVFSNNPKDSLSLGSNFIDVICEDGSNNFWIATNKGIYKLNRNSETFVAYLSKTSKDSRNITVNSLLVDKYGVLWAGTNIGLFTYSQKSDSFIQIKSPVFGTNKDFFVSSGTMDSKGNLWFATRSDILVYKASTKQFEVIRSIPEITSVISNSYTVITADKMDNIWIAVANNLVWYNHNSKQFNVVQDIVNSNNKRFYPTRLFCDDENKIWLGGENLAIIDANTKQLIPISSQVQNIFKNSDIRTIYKDRSGILWICTKYQGVYYYNRKISTFPCWNSNSGGAINNLNDNIVLSACEDDDANLWIGTRDGGINVLDRKTNTFHYYLNNTSNKLNSTDKFISYLAKGQNKEMWVGTLFNLININTATEKITKYNIPGINHLFFDNGKLWIGTRNGLIIYDTKLNSIIKDTIFDRLFIDYKGKEVTVIVKDRDGLIWIGWQNEGLTCYDPLNQKAQYYFHTNDTSSLSDNAVRSIYQDKKGRLWVGTKLEGLNLFNPLKNNFINYTIKDGLSSNSIYHILEDSVGCLWMGTHNGISTFDPDTKKVVTFSSDFGLQSNVFIQRAFCTCRNGELLMGGNNGFNLFRPSQIKKIYNNAPVIVNYVKVYNHTTALDISIDTFFVFKYDQNYISFEFSLLDYQAPLKNHYKYKMEKVDPDWVESGNRHFVSYSELKPGKYTFKILASNSDGYWVKDVRTIHITILPPWWRTWWFRLMLFVIISLVIYYIYKARISYLENRQEELEAIVKVRTKELSESNEVLQEQAARIEEQSEELRITNEQLLYRQEVIEGQSNELKIFSNNIKEANDLLIERQKTIEDQSLLLKTSNKELLILNSTKDKFFSIIAHDLRNPFNTIMGFSEVLVSKCNSIPEEKVIKYLDLINASAIHANNLLENQLQWSRSQTDRISFEPVKTKLCALVMETMYLSEGAMLKKNITSSVQVPEELEVFADENMLKTVLRNLISNAIKFTDNGTITIAANNSNEATEIRISDTGVGISEEHLSKLFHIATNISTLGTNNEVGTGLGLILCYEFISKHAGSITVESKIGEGTTFMVKLPLKR